MDVDNFRQRLEGISFTPVVFFYQCKQKEAHLSRNSVLFYSICPVIIVRHYVERTDPLHIIGSVKNSSFFLSWIQPHQPVSSASVAHWLKTVPSNAGIDTSVLKHILQEVDQYPLLQIQVWFHLSPPHWYAWQSCASKNGKRANVAEGLYKCYWLLPLPVQSCGRILQTSSNN